MATSAGGLVERLRGVAMKAGTQGVRLVVDGARAALEVADRLQEKLPVRERVVRTKQAARPPEGERYGPELERAKASMWMTPPETPEESRPAPARKAPRAPREARPTPEVRRKEPRSEPARRAQEKPKAPRTAGRKTLHTETPAPRESGAKKGSSKVKRGQKLRHH